MKKTLILFSVAVTGMIINSCKTDFKTIAPYKEMACVYGLLDNGQNPNYIRINRVFLTDGDATQTAQNDDSVNYKPGELAVTLEKYKDGTQTSTTTLTEFTTTLPFGDFNANQRLWACNSTLASLSENSNEISYKLKIHNNKTGKNFESSTSLIKDITTFQGGILNYMPGLVNMTSPTFPVKVLWNNPENAKTDNLNLRFHYREYTTSDTVNPALYTDKYVDWNFGDQIMNDPTDITAQVEYSFMGDAFYAHLKNTIAADPNVFGRKFLRIEVIVTAVGTEFQLFSDVNAPSNTIVQDKPIYTNISDGVGVFSSRRKKSFIKYLNNASVKQLAAPTSPTCGLRFYDDQGVMSLGCQ